jgi:hemerythrin-like domain-containing protein
MTIQVPNNSLWQYIEKDHIDSNIKKSVWENFVASNQDKFAERVSEIAEELWENYNQGVE